MVQNGLKIDKPRCKLVDVVMAGKGGESKKVKKNKNWKGRKELGNIYGLNKGMKGERE